MAPERAGRTPEVTVVLPVRDGGEALDGAVASALASRGVALELICIDDGSRDETRVRLAAWAARDSRVRVLRTRPDGLIHALNRGLEAARAPLVARLDADDEMHPDRLALQRRLLAERPDVGLAGCLVESFREGGLGDGYRLYTDWANGLVAPDEIEREAFVECPVPHPTWMLRTAEVRALGGYRERGWPEDVDLFYRLLESGARACKVPRVLYRWRDHPARLSRNDPRYDRRAFQRVKAHFVGRLFPMSGAVVWGGRHARRLAGLLRGEGLPTRALIDVHPDRIGTDWRGLPILSPSTLAGRAPAWRREGLRILGAVASRGAREQIRSHLSGLGLDEGRDYLMVA